MPFFEIPILTNAQMPILIKDYTWRQTEENVVVRVPLQNTHPSKVDLFTSDIYIKVHFPPFLFEVCLFEPISEEKSKCMLVNGEAVFELSKLEKKEWSILHRDISKKEMIKVKEEAIQRAHQKAEKESKEKKESKHKRRKDCVKRQVEQESVLRENIENLKKEEHHKALQDVLEWKATETADDKVLLSTLGKALLEYNKKASSLKSDKKNDETYKSSNQKEDITKPLPTWLAVASKPVKRPPPRKGGTIKTEFTYRAFPTPCRESQLTAEEEWLKKQAEARRLTGFVAEDLRPEEKDPEWLLNRGKSFHDVGNYLGAISAFSYAIQNWEKIPELHVARAESNAAIGNWRNVLRDTSNGLDLCRPHVAANADMRFKCHFYRGLALIELGRPQSAVADLEEALELRPYDEKLHHLLDRAENEKPEQYQQEKGPDHKYIEPEELAN